MPTGIYERKPGQNYGKFERTPEYKEKLRTTMISRYGSDYYRNMGKVGGKAGTGHAFGHGKVDPQELGRRGGRISRREWSPEQRQAVADRSIRMNIARKASMSAKNVV